MKAWQELLDKPEEWEKLSYNDPRLDEFAHDVEDRYGLPRGVIEAIKNAGERTPSKASGRPTVSHAGAKGVMQFIDSTRKEYEHDVNDPFDSIDAAGRYIADLLKDPAVAGNPMAAIAWYNGGKRAAEAVVNGRPPPAAETRGYILRVQEYMESKYGGEG